MAKAKLLQMVIPKFSGELEEAAWWDALRAEVEVDIRAKLTNLDEAPQLILTSVPLE
jgi:hypothetical protein